VDDAALSARVGSLLVDSGIGEGDVQLSACATGGNNRVYLAQVGGERYAVKRYFVHPADPRDRLRAEYAFLEYAKAIGLRCVPQPVACSPADYVAIYEFIDGRKLQADELSAHHVEQALAFLRELNLPEHRRLAGGLEAASEARFSIAEHLELVQQAHRSIEDDSWRFQDRSRSGGFVARLAAVWDELQVRILASAERGGLHLEKQLEQDNRCISPSDFGFHNALVGEHDEVFFIDFEYAGWDDPAKTVSDFFSHPAVPVPSEYFEPFLASGSRFRRRPGAALRACAPLAAGLPNQVVLHHAERLLARVAAAAQVRRSFARRGDA
jgi:predicted Ser/Thr protein kinase